MTTTEPHPDILAERADDPIGEALLLQAVRDGSTGAFGILYARYRPFAVGLALQALPRSDAAVAEDVVELSFLRVLTALRNGKGPTDALRPYLTTTIRREAWRAQRRRRRHAELVDQWAAGEASVVPAAAGAEVADSDLSSHVLLEEAFRGLSDRWRHILWLTVVEGRKPAEVAPMLGVSAGSASALSYRARNGLVSAYIGVYRRSTSDVTCLALADQLERYVAAGAPSDGFAEVAAHLEGCRRCREVSRGVDVLGTVLASMAPFGLLTVGWWAQSAGVGAAGLLAGTAVAGAAGGLGAAGTAATAASGGVGVGTAVAAAAAVVVLAGAAWFGATRTDAPKTEGAARVAPQTDPAPEPSQPQTSVEAAQRSVTLPPAAAPTSAPTATTTASSTTTGSSSVATTTATTAASSPTATTTTVASSSSSTTSTSAASTTTTTTRPPTIPRGRLNGRATSVTAEGDERPVDGIVVVAYDDLGRLAGRATTDPDGRWAVPDLPAGRYLVAAVVPSQYRPATGEDPWTGGATWATILGEVELIDQPLDLVDLRLVDR